jgi:hypothetical protein
MKKITPSAAGADTFPRIGAGTYRTTQRRPSAPLEGESIAAGMTPLGIRHLRIACMPPPGPDAKRRAFDLAPLLVGLSRPGIKWIRGVHDRIQAEFANGFLTKQGADARMQALIAEADRERLRFAKHNEAKARTRR